MAITYFYCQNCKTMVATSLTGKCKVCGTPADLKRAIASSVWDAKSPEDRAAYLNGETEKAAVSSQWEKAVTTTAGFEGRQIEAYLGTVYGTNIYTVGGVLGGGLANQEKLFGAAFADAKKKMYDRAVALGGDAVVGMQTIMTSPGGMNEMIVIATGTAVALKKEDE